MVVFPLVAMGVSAVFAALLLRNYSTKHRMPQLAWGVAMTMFAVASLAVAIGTARGWGPTTYRVYWLFGAVLNVPWLALGSVALLNKKVISAVAIAIVAAASVWGVVRVVGAHTCGAVVGPTHICVEAQGQAEQAQVFGGDDIPSGRDVWSKDRSIRTLAVIYSLVAYVVVILLALWTSRRRKGVAPPRSRVHANLLISIGVTIVAVGSTALARFGRGSVFSVTLALGVVVMFTGFLLSSRAPRHRVEEPGDSPT